MASTSVFALDQVSIPTLISPAHNELYVDVDSQFEVSVPTTFDTANPELTSPATLVSNEFLISHEEYFKDDILGGATGYADFSEVGDKQYQILELNEASNIIVDGKRLSTIRIYNAPIIEFLTDEGEIVGKMSAIIGDLSHMTNSDEFSVIPYTRYTNGATFSWSMKSSPTSPTKWAGSVKASISENLMYWSTTEVEDDSPSETQEFHKIDTGGLSIEIDINGERKIHSRTMKEIAIENAADLGNFPQVTIELPETAEAGEFVTGTYFTRSPDRFKSEKTRIYQTSSISSVIDDFNMIFPERYTVSVRQKALLANGKTISSNWSSGQYFTTKTDIETELTPIDDITEYHVKSGETAELRFIVKNIGQVDATEAVSSFRLTDVEHNHDIDGYIHKVFSLTSPDYPDSGRSGAYSTNDSVSKGFTFEEFPVGSSKEIRVHIYVDPDATATIRKLEYKTCVSQYCSDTEYKSIKICVDGVCPQTYEEMMAGFEDNDDGGGQMSYFFLMLFSLFATRFKITKN